MPLLMIDLDNTLIDRDAAFGSAVADFLDLHRLPAADLDWVMSVDASGYTPRPEVAAALLGRYGTELSAAVHELLDNGAADRVVLDDPVRRSLIKIRNAGWTCMIVTNGRTAQQQAKIKNAGLERLVDGWVISEQVGHKKPSPEIFRAAAGSAGVQLDGAWMIGDSPHADIGGAHGLGLSSVWVSGGQAWNETAFRPSQIATECSSAIDRVIENALGWG